MGLREFTLIMGLFFSVTGSLFRNMGFEFSLIYTAVYFCYTAFMVDYFLSAIVPLEPSDFENVEYLN